MVIGDLLATLDGLSLFVGGAVGLLGGVLLLLFSRFSMKRSFDRAMTEQKSAFDAALSNSKSAYETATNEMKSSFESLSNEALLRNQTQFLELASGRFEDQEKQHSNTLDGKKELIDTQLQAMSKSMSETLNTVPERLDKNEKTVGEVIEKSAKSLETSNKTHLTQLQQRSDTQTKEHLSKLDEKELQINRRLGEMDAKLGEVQTLITEFEKARESKLGALDDQLKNLTQTTSALQRALADNRARGQWGERIAEDLLQLLGFVEGRNYYKQMTQMSGERPDFTICLPNGLYVNMDVKYSFDNYDSYHSADSPQERKKYATAFLRNVKSVVNDVASKAYINEQTVDCVLLLIPNEPVYRFIHEQDYTIMDAALRSKIILCSPLNLYPVLAVIHQAAQSLAFERKSREIFAVLTEIRSEWAKYSEHMDGMEKNFATLERKFRELTGARSNQLDRKFDKIDTLLADNGSQTWEGAALPQLPADAN